MIILLVFFQVICRCHPFIELNDDFYSIQVVFFVKHNVLFLQNIFIFKLSNFALIKTFIFFHFTNPIHLIYNL